MIDEYLFYESEIVEDDEDAPEGLLVQTADQSGYTPADKDVSDDDGFFEIVDEEEAPESETHAERASVQNEDVILQEEDDGYDDEIDYINFPDSDESEFADAQESETDVAEEPVTDKQTEQAFEAQAETTREDTPSAPKTVSEEQEQPAPQNTAAVQKKAEQPKTAKSAPKTQKSKPAQAAGRTATRMVEQSSPAARKTNERDENTLSDEHAHIRTGIKSLSRSNSVQSVLGGSNFTIDTNSKVAQKTVSTAKKYEDPWAVAKFDASPRKEQTNEDIAEPAPKKKRASKNQSSDEAQQKNNAANRSQQSADTAYNKLNKNSMEANTMAKEKETVKATTATKATKSEPAKAAKAAPAKAPKAEPAKAAKPAVSEPTPVVEETQNAAARGKFVIKRTDNDNYVFKLFSSNGRVVAISAGFYTSLSACKNGIQSVINNAGTAPIEDQTLVKFVEQKCPKWIVYADKRGEVRLRLIASNGNMVASTNDGYLSRDAAKKGIDAIARAAQNADVIRNDDLW